MPWSNRKPDASKTRAWITAFNQLTDLISGEEPASLIKSHLQQTEKKKLASIAVKHVHGDSEKRLLESLGEQCNNVNSNINKQCFFRRNVCKAVARAYTLDSAKKAGFNVHKDFWANIRQHLTDHGLDFMDRKPGGRKGITKEQQKIIRDIVMSDLYTAPVAGATHKVEDARALITSRANIYRKEEKIRNICAYSVFVKQTNGHTHSATPNLREFHGQTDKCVVCADFLNKSILLRGVATSASDKSGSEELMVAVDDLIEEGCHSLTTDISRGQSHEIKAIVRQLQTGKDTRVNNVNQLVSDIILLGKHVYFHKTIRQKFNDIRLKVTSDYIVKNSDWKENGPWAERDQCCCARHRGDECLRVKLCLL